MEHRISHVIGFLLYIDGFFLLPFEITYGQHHLNRLGARRRRAREGGDGNARASADLSRLEKRAASHPPPRGRLASFNTS
jgi:hypothetical protein